MGMKNWFLGTVLGLMTACAIGQPADIFYDDLDPDLHAEVKTFVEMYTHVLIHGTPAPEARDFAYTEPEANSSLFSPYIAYLRTLATAKVGDRAYFGHIVGPAEVAAYAESSTVTTSIDDMDSTLNHFAAIDAVGGSSVQASIQDGELVSTGLPVGSVAGEVPYVAQAEPPAYEAWMAYLGSLAGSITDGFDPAEDIGHMLLGEPTNTEILRSSLHAWLEIERPLDTKLGSYVIHAMFGKFGALPVVVISYDSGYLLVDGMNGFVIGPFLYEDEIDTLPLLAMHLQHFGSGSASNIDVNNSSTVVLAKKWREAPPQGYVPDPSCTPAGCWLPRQPSTPTGTPFYSCTLMANGNCKCTATGTMTSTATPPGPPIPTKIECIYPSTGGDCNTNGTPPAFIPPPADCTQTYYYDR